VLAAGVAALFVKPAASVIRAIRVDATWYADEQVWIAESPNLPGLVTGGDALWEVCSKLPGMVQDLLDCEGYKGAFCISIRCPNTPIAQIEAPSMVRRSESAPAF
jgi:hypothetical protein